MWISEKLQDTAKGEQLSYSHVVTAGESPCLSEKGLSQVIHPYGLYSRLPSGQDVACLGATVLGLREAPPVELKEGDVCLYTEGGYLLLTREGKVIVNGRELIV